jgi:hypothetical protein
VIEKVGKPEAVAADAAYTSYLFNKDKRGSEFFNSDPLLTTN